jgi:tetratricopeptide (TPR) repeat protein
MRLRLVAIVWLLVAACPAGALGQRRPPPEAVEFYESGRAHYRAGRYREAIADLERALTLDPGSATLIFNLARVHELLGEIDNAILYYTQYLQVLTPEQDEERERVEETIGRLRGARDTVRTQAPPEPPAVPPEDDEENEPRWVTAHGIADTPFWVVAGGSAALLLGGCIVGLLALQAEAYSTSFVLGIDGEYADLEAADDRANALALGADILFILGGGAAIAAGLLFGIRSRTYEVLPEDVSPTVALLENGAVLGLRGPVTW